MSKAVVYILSTAAIFIFFITLSPKLNLEKPKGRVNRRILERAPNFDPIVTKIERETEKKLQPQPQQQQQPQQQHVEAEANSPRVSVLGLNNTTSVNEVAETYQYLTSGGKLNTTLRLIILFPLLDREPKDGVVDFNELEAWVSQRAVERLNYVTKVELETRDKDGDLALSFNEYLPHFSEKDIEEKKMGHGDAGWWMERFNIADLDHNGLLNFTELKDLMHPEDSKNQEMLKWVVRDKLKLFDLENEGKVNFNEFEDHLYSTYESYVDFENNGGDVPDAKDIFAELDVNKDQYLSIEELIPILSYIYPGELAYAKYFTCYLMNEADDNVDRTLTLQEMLNHEYIFYNTVHADIHVESDEDHDEL